MIQSREPLSHSLAMLLHFLSPIGIGSIVRDVKIRMVIAVALAMNLVLAAVFSGNLAAAFSSRKVQRPIRNMEELLADTSYQFIVPKGSIGHLLLQVKNM